MVRKGQDRFVLWPRYFDRSVSRAEGRRVPGAQAVKQPDAQWVAVAAKKAGLDPEVEEKARDPFAPYEKSGRVLVKRTGSKQSAIAAVAAIMHAQSEKRD